MPNHVDTYIGKFVRGKQSKTIYFVACHTNVENIYEGFVVSPSPNTFQQEMQPWQFTTHDDMSNWFDVVDPPG